MSNEWERVLETMLRILGLIHKAMGLLWGFLSRKYHDQGYASGILVWQLFIEGL